MVERIIQKIIKDNVDVDKLLVVTFTNAAATEIRERVLNAIYKKIEESQENTNLQRQILLLNKSNISTIHAFCLEIIRNNFYELGISHNFRLADSSEIEMLKMESIEEIFDKLYEENNKEFIKLVNTYCGYKDDDALKEIILKIYNKIQSNPFPKEWLDEKVQEFDLHESLKNDFASTKWGRILLENAKENLLECIGALKNLQGQLKREEELNKFYLVISEDINNISGVLNIENWDEMQQKLADITFSRWPVDKKVILEIKDMAKEARDKIKKDFEKIKNRFFVYNSKEANEDIYEMYDILKELAQIIVDFSNRYTEKKKEKNVIDFNDIEHYALQLLVEKDEDGECIPTEIAKSYQKKFVEVAIDEYQDSNLVQEYILKSVSNGNNLFMVGDVKQSIYKFRQARPKLFLEKYSTYKNIEDKEANNIKIKLFENFRSRRNILDLTNLIFKDIMSKELGGIEYDQDEFLNVGKEYDEPMETIKNYGGKAELDIINLLEQSNLDEENSEEDLLENTEYEAKFVAKKIKEFVNSNYYVFDKETGYRKLEYRDIVILLRAPNNVADYYEKELTKYEFPVFCDTSTNYFESTEIQIIISLLKIIDNPYNDIALVSILRSPIVGMTDNELVEIRLQAPKKSYYEALIKAKEKLDEKGKIKRILEQLEDFRKKQEYLKLDELIWYIYQETGYYNYTMLTNNGTLKIANLKMLFEKAKEYENASFKGLYNFINFIDRAIKSGSDMGAPKLIGENENVIRIMSIHKSKGLEFPIVFLCGTGKQFNIQDLNEKILLNEDLGLGPKYINYSKKIEYNTLAKEVLRIKEKEEILAEEMRLLYVALTRSREKLFITGVEKNLEKSLQDKQKIIDNNNGETAKLSKATIKRGKSYLDWLEMVLLYDKKIKEVLDINYINKESFKNDQIEEKRVKTIIKLKETSEKIREMLEWKYDNIEATKLEGKTSVSKIAKNVENTGTKEPIKLDAKPDFIEERAALSGAEKGTIMHLALQKLDFRENYTEQSLINLINGLVTSEIITMQQKECINIEAILNFTKSDLFKEVQEAEKIYKEEPFYINLPAKEVYNVDIEENVLVQGIIDLYFISKDGKVVLVDYKTDYVPKEREDLLMKKYESQINLYKKAIEESLNRKVEKMYIYSIYLNKAILMN